jgi:hypothetical protein
MMEFRRRNIVMFSLTSTILALLFVETTCATSTSSSSSSPPSIPRSTNTRSIYTDNTDNEKIKPPWNISPNIDKEGFFTSKYKRVHGEWEHGIVDYDDDNDDNDDMNNHDYEHENMIENTSADMNTDENANSNANEDQIHEEEAQPAPIPILSSKYHCLDEPVYIRQVPGDGNCLFHSISVSMALVANRTHIEMTARPHPRTPSPRNNNHNLRNTKHPTSKSRTYQYQHDLEHLHHHSRHLRSAAVDILSRNPRKLLFLQGNEYLRAKDLVSAAAAQYGMTGKEYCEQMRKDSYWGGGPEIVALCNFLKRPIHVYELSSGVGGGDGCGEDADADVDDVVEDSNENEDGEGLEDENENDRRQSSSSGSSKSKYNSQFQLRRMACFGSPKFDRREALHILSADSRFPDIEKGKQLASGNHFLALFPEELIASIMEEEKKIGKKRERKERKLRHQRADVRGGEVNFDDEVDVFWSSGILKYVNIDFIWKIMHRLKLVFL